MNATSMGMCRKNQAAMEAMERWRRDDQATASNNNMLLCVHRLTVRFAFFVARGEENPAGALLWERLHNNGCLSVCVCRV